MQQDAGFDLGGYFRFRWVCDINHPNRVGINDIRISQARNLATLQLHAFLSFLGRESEGRNGDASRITVATWDNRIIKHSNIRDKKLGAIAR